MRSMSVIVACCALATILTGCGNYVSNKEYFETSFGPPRMMDDVHAFRSSEAAAVAVPHREAEPRVKVIHLPATAGVDLSSRDPLAALRAGEKIERPVNLNAMSLSVKRELESLERELAQIAARARLKGAAGEAALEPSSRAFRNSAELAAEYIIEARSVRGNGDGQAVTVQLNEALGTAREAVREGAAAVDRLPAAVGSRRVS